MANLKTNCIIVHGCIDNDHEEVKLEKNPKTRSYNKHWMPWIKKELLKQGIETKIPLMPKPWIPNYKNFKKKFDNYKINKNTI
ncbi:MAG: hypothetical protein V1824_01800 [archaeon]